MASPLILVAYAIDPGPGGAEAEVNGRFVRALRDHWPAPVTLISAGSVPPTEDNQPLVLPPSWRVHAIGECGERGTAARPFNLVAAWSLARMRAGGAGSLPARAINRGTYLASGEGVKRAWQHTASRLLRRELAAQPGAIVYSRALPFASIAAVASVRATRRFPWIVNINDPIPAGLWPGLYTTNPDTDRRVDAALRRAFPQISAFTFPTTQLRDLECDRYPEMAQAPQAILPHVAPQQHADQRADAHEAPNRPLTIVFLGVLRGNRVRQEFFEGLRLFASANAAAAGSTKVTFLVPERSVRLAEVLPGLESMVDIRVTKEVEAFAHAAGTADVLLDLESEPDAPLLLTKVARAIGRRKPLWAVCARGGTTWTLMHEHAAGYVTPLGDAAAVARTLQRIHDDWRLGQLEERGPGPALSRYFSGEQVVSELAALCATLTSATERHAAPARPMSAASNA